jgi:hypothetical protein
MPLESCVSRTGGDGESLARHAGESMPRRIYCKTVTGWRGKKVAEMRPTTLPFGMNELRQLALARRPYRGFVS